MIALSPGLAAILLRTTGYDAITVAMDPRNPAVVYAATPWGLIKKSVDSGSTWTDITANNYVVDPSTLAVHPTSSGTILVGGSGGVWGTTNDGLSWSSQVQGLVAQDIVHFSASPDTDRIYFNTNENFVGYVPCGASNAISINEDAIQQLVQGGCFVWRQHPTHLSQRSHNTRDVGQIWEGRSWRSEGTSSLELLQQPASGRRQPGRSSVSLIPMSCR